MATFIQVRSRVKTNQKGKEEKIGGGGCVLYLDMGVRTCQNSLSRTRWNNAFYTLLYGCHTS